MAGHWGWLGLATLSVGLAIGCGATRRDVDESDGTPQGAQAAQGGSSAGAAVLAGSGGTEANAGASTEPSDALLEACTQLAEKWCERIEACSPAELASRYGASAFPGVSSCVAAERDRCVDWFSKVQGLASSVEAVLAAAPSTCAQAFDYYAPYRTGEPGTLARGATCKWDEQCATGYCTGSADALCGTCDFVPPIVEPEPGEACPDGICPAPFACHETICRVPPGEGEACLQLGTVPSHYDICAENLLCAGGTCVSPLFFGEACSTDDDHCDVLHGLACQAGKCGLSAPLHVEGMCGGYPDNQGTCGLNDTCVFAGDPSFDDRPGKCAPRQTGAGTPCSGPAACPSGLECVPGGDVGSVGGSGNAGIIGFCGPHTVSTNCE